MFSCWVLISTTKCRSHIILNEKIENLINSNCRKRRKPFFSLLHNRRTRNLRMKRLDYRLYRVRNLKYGCGSRVGYNIIIIRPAWIIQDDQRTAFLRTWAPKMAIMTSFRLYGQRDVLYLGVLQPYGFKQSQ